MGQYIFRAKGTRPIGDNYKPFKLLKYNGDDPIEGGQNWIINNGICYSTFSYDSGSYVPIANLNEKFILEKDDVVYIDFGVLPNLQVTGGVLKHTKVGSLSLAKNSPELSPEEWVDYPDYYRIRPFDNTDENGRVISLVDGKKQQNCYLMIGRVSEKINEFITAKEINYDYTKFYNEDTKSNLYFIQYCNTDILLMGSHISGVPIVFPLPYFGGPATSDKAQLIF